MPPSSTEALQRLEPKSSSNKALPRSINFARMLTAGIVHRPDQTAQASSRFALHDGRGRRHGRFRDSVALSYQSTGSSIYQRGLARYGLCFTKLMRQSHIAGEWLSATEASANINPSNTSDMVGDLGCCHFMLSTPLKDGSALPTNPVPNCFHLFVEVNSIIDRLRKFRQS